MEKGNPVNIKRLRRILKAVLIPLSIIMLIGVILLHGTDDVYELSHSVSSFFAVMFGIVGSAFGASLARYCVKIDPPSRKLLVIVICGAVAGAVLGAILSKFILQFAFAASIVMGVIAVIAGIIGSMATYWLTISVFAGGTVLGSINMSFGLTADAVELRKRLANDKSGLDRDAFNRAVQDLENRERER